MSKFIAMLCAAAMLMSTATVALADDTAADNSTEVSDEYYDESYNDYYDSSEEYYEDDYTDMYVPEDDYSQEFDESYVEDNYVEDTPYVVPEYDPDAANGVVIEKIETVIEDDSDAPAEETPATDAVFTDVAADAYYADAVAYCYEKGLFNGMTDTEFAPDVTMTRGMFATVFGRIQNADLTNVTLTYADVKADAYYASYIAWATQEGIMEGYSDDAFGPDDAITREQAAKMLHAYLANVKNIAITDVAANYADIANVSDWAAAAINANTSVGYLLTDENNNINPTAELTRADACYAVAATIKLVEALEAEGLKDVEEAPADEEAIEIPEEDAAPVEEETTGTVVDTQAQMGEIPEADKDASYEEYWPDPGSVFDSTIVEGDGSEEFYEGDATVE